MIKLLSFTFTLLWISSSYSCSVKSELLASTLFQSGLTNKLLETNKYNDSYILDISYNSFPNHYDVVLEDQSSKKCYQLLMHSYGKGSCEFTADILEEKEVSCSTF